MTREQIENTVLQVVDAANLARSPSQRLVVAPDAPLFGEGSPLDSLGLVGLLADVEDTLRDEGVEVELADARAMSQTRSPFRSVATLVDYIHQLLSARHET